MPAVVSQVCDGLYEDGSELSDEERSLWEEKVLLLLFIIVIIFFQGKRILTKLIYKLTTLSPSKISRHTLG